MEYRRMAAVPMERQVSMDIPTMGNHIDCNRPTQTSPWDTMNSAGGWSHLMWAQPGGRTALLAEDICMYPWRKMGATINN